jgi:hypothetical protein
LTVWITSYVVMMLAIIASLVAFRSWSLSEFDSEAAQRNWQAWRDAAVESGWQGGVNRARPKSAEPPTLVMMRDHFGVCLAIVLVLATALYATVMIVLRGVLLGRAHRP